MTTPARPEPDVFPYDDLHGALGEHPGARTSLDALHSEVRSDSPRRDDVEQHVSALRDVPVVGAAIANWFESPRTQHWLEALTDIGL